jgi:hypothetical protein
MTPAGDFTKRSIQPSVQTSVKFKPDLTVSTDHWNGRFAGAPR